jgi:hypothetical protein
MALGHYGERDSGLCRVRRTTVVRQTKRLYLCLNLGVHAVGSIQVCFEYARGFGCQKSRSVRILEAQICEEVWPRLTSVGTVG